MLANQNLHVYNTKSYPIVAELASSPMEGIYVYVCSIADYNTSITNII